MWSLPGIPYPVDCIGSEMKYRDMLSLNVDICFCNLPEGGTMGSIVSLDTD